MQIRIAINKHKMFVNISEIIDNSIINEVSIKPVEGLLYSSGCFRNDATFQHPEVCKLGVAINKMLNFIRISVSMLNNNTNEVSVPTS